MQNLNNVSQANCKMDRLYYTISSHTGLRNIDSLIPKSLRARVLSLLHMLIATYSNFINY